ncbi:hypothetical protein BHE74_00051463, partial [Ensete ventricosum]
MHAAWYGRYVPVHLLIRTRITQYRAVPPIGVVFAPLPPEIGGISRERKKKREKKKRKKMREKKRENLEYGAALLI